jgi:hypothetical protein
MTNPSIITSSPGKIDRRNVGKVSEFRTRSGKTLHRLTVKGQLVIQSTDIEDIALWGQNLDIRLSYVH